MEKMTKEELKHLEKLIAKLIHIMGSERLISTHIEILELFLESYVRNTEVEDDIMRLFDKNFRNLRESHYMIVAQTLFLMGAEKCENLIDLYEHGSAHEFQSAIGEVYNIVAKKVVATLEMQTEIFHS